MKDLLSLYEVDNVESLMESSLCLAGKQQKRTSKRQQVGATLLRLAEGLVVIFIYIHIYIYIRVCVLFGIKGKWP